MAVRVKIDTIYILIGIMFFIGFLYFLNIVSYNNNTITLNFAFNTYKLFSISPINFLIIFGIDIFIVAMFVIILIMMVKE